jgi:hypothetical protein
LSGSPSWSAVAQSGGAPRDNGVAAFPSTTRQRQQTADWLEKFGMSEYTQRFAENRIDFSVLP